MKHTSLDVITITGLESETEYEFQVGAYFSDFGGSDWSEKYTVKTTNGKISFLFGRLSVHFYKPRLGISKMSRIEPLNHILYYQSLNSLNRPLLTEFKLANFFLTIYTTTTQHKFYKRK